MMMLCDDEVKRRCCMMKKLFSLLRLLLSMSHLSCQVHMHFKVMGGDARHVYYDINDDKRWGCMPDMSYYDIIDGGLCLDGTTCMCIC